MDFRKRREEILNGPISKVIIMLALPIMLNNLIQTFYDLTDTYFVGRIGGNEVAAVSLVWPLIFLMISFAIGMSAAGATLIAQYIGHEDETSARRIAGQLISFLILLGAFIGLVGAYFAPYIVKAMGADGSLYAHATTYLKIMFLGMPTIFMMSAFNAIKQGQGDNISPMIYGAISVGINIVLDPIFIFVFDLGIAGAGYATVIARGIIGIIALSSLFSTHQLLFLTLDWLKLDLVTVKRICKLGLPSSTGQAMTALGFTILNIFLVNFGEAVLTGFAISNRISSLIMMPVMGIGSALATIVGQNLGAENTLRARSAVKQSALFSTIILVMGGAIMYPHVHELISIFTTDSNVIYHGGNYLSLIILGIPLMGFFQIFNGTFQGSGHTVYSMIIMMGRLWGLRLPLVFYFSRQAVFQASNIWYAMLLSNFVICIVGWFIYMFGKWDRRVIGEAIATHE